MTDAAALVAPAPRGVERLGPRLWRTADRNGRVYLIQPLTPADAPALMRAFAEQAPEDRMMRLMSTMPRLPERMALRFCTVDPARDVALKLTAQDAPDALLGGSRLMRDGDSDRAEFAVSLASPLKGLGLGRKALETAFAAGRDIGIRRVWGSIKRDNAPMRGLAAALGMTERPDPEDRGLIVAEMEIASASPEAAAPAQSQRGPETPAATA